MLFFLALLFFCFCFFNGFIQFCFVTAQQFLCDNHIGCPLIPRIKLMAPVSFETRYNEKRNIPTSEQAAFTPKEYEFCNISSAPACLGHAPPSPPPPPLPQRGCVLIKIRGCYRNYKSIYQKYIIISKLFDPPGIYILLHITMTNLDLGHPHKNKSPFFFFFFYCSGVF